MGRIIGGGALMVLGERIRLRREALGMSQGDLADAVTKSRKRRQKPVSRISISLFENNRRVPSAASLVELADVLRCSVDYLLGRVAQPDALGGAQRRVEATTPPKGNQARSEPIVAPEGKERPAPAHEEGPSLEEAQAQADREGRTTVLWRGRLYMRRRLGWESVQ